MRPYCRQEVHRYKLTRVAAETAQGLSEEQGNNAARPGRKGAPPVPFPVAPAWRRARGDGELRDTRVACWGRRGAVEPVRGPALQERGNGSTSQIHLGQVLRVRPDQLAAKHIGLFSFIDATAVKLLHDLPRRAVLPLCRATQRVGSWQVVVSFGRQYCTSSSAPRTHPAPVTAIHVHPVGRRVRRSPVVARGGLIIAAVVAVATPVPPAATITVAVAVTVAASLCIDVHGMTFRALSLNTPELCEHPTDERLGLCGEKGTQTASVRCRVVEKSV